MLEKVFKKEGLDKKILKIVASPDDPSDDIWLDKLLKQTGDFDVVIGNNEWTNEILANAHFKVIRIPYLRRSIYQGVFIRKLKKRGMTWETRVPEYLTDLIRKEL
jgi:nicotinamide mononucleotide adenylyltransferase